PILPASQSSKDAHRTAAFLPPVGCAERTISRVWEWAAAQARCWPARFTTDRSPPRRSGGTTGKPFAGMVLGRHTLTLPALRVGPLPLPLRRARGARPLSRHGRGCQAERGG